MTYDRFKDFDFLHPVFNNPNGILIPEPSLYLGGISSIWRPFETQVYISIENKLKTMKIYVIIMYD